MDTDASGQAIGAVLSQIQEDAERVICYGSYVLTPAQRKYCVTKRELLAVVRFTRQYRHYLLGRKFLLRTDHNSLTWLLRFKYIEGQFARWIEELSQFDMTVLHRPGTKHGNADGLSRIPDEELFCDCYRAGIDPTMLPCYVDGCKFCPRAHQQWSRFTEDVDDVVPLAVKAVNVPSSHTSTWLQGYTNEQLSEAQRKDPSLKHLIDWMSRDVQPSQGEIALCSPTVKYFFKNRTQLELKNELLLYRWIDSYSERLLFVVPDVLKENIMSMNHDIPLTGHMGITKTVLRIRASFIWYKLKDDVETFVRSCAVCNQNKRAQTKPKAALGSYHAGSPLERIHVDILGPFTPSRNGNQYILMIVDQFTKWLECFPLPQQSAELTAKQVVDGFISRFGCPLEIHTDQGKNFDGKLFHAVCELLQVTKTRTTPYRPCSNGQVERYNRTLLQLMRCFLKGNQTYWDEHLQQLAGAIRSTVNRSTGFTPNMMMLGREVILPIDLMVKDIHEVAEEVPAEYVTRLKKTLMQAHDLARERLNSYQLRQRKDYDMKLKVNTYEIGDLVYVLDTARKVGFSPKLQQVWKGPMIVTKVLSPVLFRVINRKKSFVLHHDRLKPCQDRELPLWVRRKWNAILNDLEQALCPDEEWQAEDLQELFNDERIGNKPYEAASELNEMGDLEIAGNDAIDDIVDKDAMNDIVNDEAVDDTVDIDIEDQSGKELESDGTEISEQGSENEKSSNIECKLPTTRSGRERRRPKHLQDYSL